jgi:hypothetical protein
MYFDGSNDFSSFSCTIFNAKRAALCKSPYKICSFGFRTLQFVFGFLLGIFRLAVFNFLCVFYVNRQAMEVTKCRECQVQILDIHLYWRCVAECKNYDLCSSCAVTHSHDLNKVKPKTIKQILEHTAEQCSMCSQGIPSASRYAVCIMGCQDRKATNCLCETCDSQLHDEKNNDHIVIYRLTKNFKQKLLQIDKINAFKILPDAPLAPPAPRALPTIRKPMYFQQPTPKVTAASPA